MRILVRSFNDKGIEGFQNFLAEAKNGSDEPVPNDLIKSGYFSNIYRPDVYIECLGFDLKSNLAKYIYGILNKNHRIEFHDSGLWTWLSAFFFESICPLVNGRRNVQAEVRYILNIENWNRYYRHLIATPVRLFAELNSHSKIYLAGPPYRHGDLLEQLASRQEIATNKGIVEAATVLYWDDKKNSIKKGARNKTGPGILRRFTKDIIPQFQMTYDLNSMNGEEIISLLPTEFNEWLNE